MACALYAPLLDTSLIIILKKLEIIESKEEEKRKKYGSKEVRKIYKNILTTTLNFQEFISVYQNKLPVKLKALAEVSQIFF